MHMDREKYVEMLEDYAFCKSWLAVFINETLKVHIELEQLDRKLVEQALRKYWELEIECKIWRMLFGMATILYGAIWLYEVFGKWICEK